MIYLRLRFSYFLVAGCFCVAFSITLRFWQSARVTIRLSTLSNGFVNFGIVQALSRYRLVDQSLLCKISNGDESSKFHPFVV